MLYGVSLAAIMQHSIPVVAAQALAGFASGIVCAFIAGLLIPLFEIVFRITTNLTLLELSDMGNPLLQRLAMEAPGTYHHSIVVANLAQAAAVKIGANGLLARVCAYFHDVGKLAKPEFFTENMLHGENPHDELNPSMSTLLIMSHVKEGISLVRRHKLPPCLADAVAQHHGTSLVSFFYHQAKKREAEEVAAGGKGANGRSVTEESFRYEGPKPQNREMAILSIADSVEAAARSLQKPTPGRIENLVKEIVDAKLADGQLDASNLTLTDLAAIKRSFVFTLANMLHVRIAYSQDENKSLQQAGKTSPGVAEASPPDTVAGGATAIAAVE
jgi:putative nucleotidyltransferase with HDIG domain